jgi:mRNA interferase RelE/StbE
LGSSDGLYHVLVDKRAEKDLKKIPEYIADRFSRILDELEIDPINRRSGANIKKLKGHPNVFRVRIGDYRMLYFVDDKNYTVRVITVVHRKKAYKIFEDIEPYEAVENTKKLISTLSEVPILIEHIENLIK